jgi:radical SAM superfamily enzyme
MGHHGCTWCNEESYIVDQYLEEDMDLPSDETEFMKKYHKQQKKLMEENKYRYDR